MIDRPNRYDRVIHQENIKYRIADNIQIPLAESLELPAGFSPRTGVFERMHEIGFIQRSYWLGLLSLNREDDDVQ